MNATCPDADSFDVAVVGGALSGAATAILLLREQPRLRVLILEKSPAFNRRVGEATVEVSGYFLCRVLGLTRYLNESHLVKQGMRFWFANPRATTLDQATEIGGEYLSRVPAFQVDRAALDEEVLRRAAEVGAQVCRPASVGRIELCPGGRQILEVRHGGTVRKVSARWVVDASGVVALLARQQGWRRINTAHPTSAVWARWTGVKDWDGLELAGKFPAWAVACKGVRGTATNHLLGSGWWAWIIPLKGGDMSVGVVFDQRLVSWPAEGLPGDRLKNFLLQHPVGRELMAQAQWREGDVHSRKNLAYSSATFAGDGFVLVGDAAAFLDPFYSPGMDWISYSTWSAAQLVLAGQRGEPLPPRIARLNQAFTDSYQRWFAAVYQDKYEYMGEYELMRRAFQLDLGLYYLGVASQPFKLGAMALASPAFSTPHSLPFFCFMRLYNRRFAQMARIRRQRGLWGRRNDGRRELISGFTFSPKTSLPLLRALAGWGWLELTEGWRTWFSRAHPSSI